MPSATARSTGRQRAMAVMLLLAVIGAAIRYLAPQPSTLHDVGTLLLVLWLPAVGNLIAWLVRRIPRRPPPATEFAEGSAFTAHLQAELSPTPEAADVMAAAEPGQRLCTVIVGRQGFTARVEGSVTAALQAARSAPVPIEFLHPAHAPGQLAPGTRFFLLVGNTAVATATVAAQSR
ncbi:hypothetical protein HK414_19710 [Ramlibacter terrae]|uniref:Uncharacterized protein n=1 Tax=Ramlibacter terrae TaxID=2732511 RepID=A0ABX6P7P1_9BURK|nr:hypothetical protein HK414_19710 [Ramlibacter terrae]